MKLTFLFAQIFGVAAMAAAMISYQCKKHRSIMLMLMLTASLWCFHYAFLGLLTPIFMNLINVARAFVYSQREKRPWANQPFMPYAFVAASLAALALTWENAFSLLPFIASIFVAFGNWQTNTRRLRLCTVPVCVCWFIYNLANRSYPGMVNEAMTLVSVVVALIRYRSAKPTASDAG